MLDEVEIKETSVKSLIKQIIKKFTLDELEAPIFKQYVTYMNDESKRDFLNKVLENDREYLNQFIDTTLEEFGNEQFEEKINFDDQRKQNKEMYDMLENDDENSILLVYKGTTTPIQFNLKDKSKMKRCEAEKPAPKAPVKQPDAPTIACTFVNSGREYVSQYWLNCYTCRPGSTNMGVCLVCAMTCHAGHQLGNQDGEIGQLNHSTFFCDCGYGEFKPLKCKCIPISKNGSVGAVTLGDLQVDHMLILKTMTQTKSKFVIISPVNIKMAIELAGEAFSIQHITMPFIKTKYTQVDNNCLLMACGLFGFKSSSINLGFEFHTNTCTSMELVNDFVRVNTKGQISNMLDVEPMGPVVVSALYFKGMWGTPFDKNQTVQYKFTGAGGQVDINMMRQSSSDGKKTGFIETEVLSSIVLPYVGDRFVAILTLPRYKDMSMKMAFVAYDEWKQHIQFEGMKQLNVYYEVPKFKKDFTFNNMPVILKSAGFDFDAFQSATQITDVIHKVVIEVDEVGTSGSAATAMVAKGGLSHDKTWIGDRPFFFSIVDKLTLSIVFGGVVDFSM